jgi:hypothetical protein
MLLEFDGLDTFDEEQWEKLNPQQENHDDFVQILLNEFLIVAPTLL